MRILFSTFVAALVLIVPAWAKPVVELDDDDKPKRKYSVDEQGRKDGLLTELHPSGKVKLRANYKAGKLDGIYTEYTEAGDKSLSAMYQNGKLHGLLTQYVKGKAALTQRFQEGKPVYPKSLAEIRKTLKEILAVSEEKGLDKLNAERQATLRRLKAFRYLVDVPYDNLVLDEDMNEAAQAGAKLCAELRVLDHTPKKKPEGWSEEEFKLAYKGTSHSNLAAGVNTNLLYAMSEWMADSDETNVKRIGHRRWCINPPMMKVGIGRSGMFMAMWVFDKSQPRVPDYDFVCYPARGLMPLEYFRSTSAWSVSLNPKKYRKPATSVQPKIYRVDNMLRKVGEPLELNYKNVDTLPFGIPYCIIFRPVKSAVAVGKRYLVEIDGLKRPTGEPTVLRYVVELARLN
jgi:hypothetical protein